LWIRSRRQREVERAKFLKMIFFAKKSFLKILLPLEVFSKTKIAE
jgi:hypothetical protein